MIYLPKTNDQRFLYLKEALSLKKEVLYQWDCPLHLSIDEIVLPLEGIDSFGYLKGTNLKLSTFLENNSVKKVYTGTINERLRDYQKEFSFDLKSFYDDPIFLKKSFYHDLEIIRCFLCEKSQQMLEDIKILVIGKNSRSYIASQYFNCDIDDSGSLYKNSNAHADPLAYDVFLMFSEPIHLESLEKFSANKTFIFFEPNVFFSIGEKLSRAKVDIYFINQLEHQYLTKTGGKLLYDCMVRFYDCL